MKFVCSVAVVLGMMAKGSFGLSLSHVQQQHIKELDSEGVFSESGYKLIAKLKDDLTMSEFVKRLLAREDKFVPQDQEGELTGFVQWFSGTKAVQSYAQMRKELADKSWVKDLKTIDGASLSEADYQAVASSRNDTAMSLLATAMLRSSNKFVSPEQLSELDGFVPWFSGTKAVQSLETMQSELFVKPWVKEIELSLVAGEGPKAGKPTRQQAKASLEKLAQILVAEAANASHKANATFATNGQVKVAEAANSTHRKANATVETKEHTKHIEAANASQTKANATVVMKAHDKVAEAANVSHQKANATFAAKGQVKVAEAANATHRKANATVETKEHTKHFEAANTSQKKINAMVEVKTQNKVAEVANVSHKKANATVATNWLDKVAEAANATHRKANETVETKAQKHVEAASVSHTKAKTTVDMRTQDKVAAVANVSHQKANATVGANGQQPGAANGRCSDCIVWGEANILSFTASRSRADRHPARAIELHAREDTTDQFTVSEAGTYWLVNNDNVQIQGRYWQYNRTRHGLGLGAIAISGRMVGENTLVIRAMSGKITWNGQQILQKVKATFSNNFMSANYLSDVGAVAADTHSPGIEFKFANGVRLSVARYRHKLTARLTVCESHVFTTPTSGQCGNLMETKQRANVWLAAQSGAAKLPISEIVFPDGRAKHTKH